MSDNHYVETHDCYLDVYTDSNGNEFIRKSCKYNDPQFDSAFKKECQKMNQLSMPADPEGMLPSRLFPVYYRCGTDPQGRPYVEMEYIKGPTLKEFLNQRAADDLDHHWHDILPKEDILSLMRCLTASIELLFAANIYHFDLHLDNFIVVSEHPLLVRLIDFTSSMEGNDINEFTKISDTGLQQYTNLAIPYMQLQACRHFFARLHYSSDDDYLDNYQSKDYNVFFQDSSKANSDYQSLLLEEEVSKENAFESVDNSEYDAIFNDSFCSFKSLIRNVCK